MVLMMKNKYTSLIIGGIVIFVTLLIFCAIKSKETIDYVALTFIVLAEVACVGVFYMSSQSSKYRSLAVTPIITIYAVVSILFSLFFKGALAENVSSFVIIHIVFMALAAIAILISNGIMPKIEQGEKKTLEKMAVIQECENRALILSKDERLAEYHDILTKIYNEIKYNDKVSDYKSSEILTVLNEISDKKEDADLPAICRKAIQLVNERNIVVKHSKRGGF